MNTKKYAYDNKVCMCCDKTISYFAYHKHLISKKHIKNELKQTDDLFMTQMITKFGQSTVDELMKSQVAINI